jgi:hypothetical protein
MKNSKPYRIKPTDINYNCINGYAFIQHVFSIDENYEARIAQSKLYLFTHHYKGYLVSINTLFLSL